MWCFRLFFLRLALEKWTLLSYSCGYEHTIGLCSVLLKWMYGILPHLFFWTLQEQQNCQDCFIWSVHRLWSSSILSASQALKYYNSLSRSNVPQIFYFAIPTYPRKRIVMQRSFVYLASTMHFSPHETISNFSPWISTYGTDLSLWRHLINA